MVKNLLMCCVGTDLQDTWHITGPLGDSRRVGRGGRGTCRVQRGCSKLTRMSPVAAESRKDVSHWKLDTLLAAGTSVQALE